MRTPVYDYTCLRVHLSISTQVLMNTPSNHRCKKNVEIKIKQDTCSYEHSVCPMPSKKIYKVAPSGERR